MSSRAIATVDVFTSTAYAGNPVAVVLEADGLTTEAMQRFAHWTNLSETTFVLAPTEVAAALRIDASAIVDARWAHNGPPWIAVMLRDAAAVLAVEPGPCEPDIGLVGPHPPGAEADFEVRAFFPKDGVTVEDPVTGSLNAGIAQWLIGEGLATALRRDAGHRARTRGARRGHPGSHGRDLDRRRHGDLRHRPRRALGEAVAGHSPGSRGGRGTVFSRDSRKGGGADRRSWEGRHAPAPPTRK